GGTREVTVSDLTQIHRFDRGIYAGTKDPGGNSQDQNPSSQFRPLRQSDVNGNLTWMNWSEDGQNLQSVTDALWNTTPFEYDNQGRLESSTDAQGRITEYTYGSINAPRQPTVIKVYDSDGTTVLRWQEYTYTTNGRATDERLVDPNDG